MHTHLSSMLQWMVSSRCKTSFTAVSRCNVSFSPVSLRMATTCFCFMSFGPNSIRIGTPCIKKKKVVELLSGGMKCSWYIMFISWCDNWTYYNLQAGLHMQETTLHNSRLSQHSDKPLGFVGYDTTLPSNKLLCGCAHCLHLLGTQRSPWRVKIYIPELQVENM